MINFSTYSPPSPKAAETRVPLREKIRALREIIPTFVVFFVIMGSIYGGIATPTEAAALGIICALVLVAMNGRLSVAMLHHFHDHFDYCVGLLPELCHFHLGPASIGVPGDL